MTELNRRGFLRASAGAAAAGVVITTLPAGLAAATGKTKGDRGEGDDSNDDVSASGFSRSGPPAADPIIAYVRNRATGEIVLYAGTGEIVVRNKVLVRQLDRAASAAKQD
jgi:hypothetical protein